MASQSSADRVIGPILSKLQLICVIPDLLTAPKLGLRPVTPQSAAGIGTEPPVSDPMANGREPDATTAAEPEEEPPAQRDLFHGLEQGPVDDAEE